MTHEQAYRAAYREPSVELVCPACGLTFMVAPPESIVSLTACPHPACQDVALICRGDALDDGHYDVKWRGGCVAMSFDRFVNGSPPLPWSEIVTFVLSSVLLLCPFTVVAGAMCVHAWRVGGQLLTIVGVCTSPALLLGALLLVVLVWGPIDSWRSWRRTLRCRITAFRRAQWQLARRAAPVPNPGGQP